MKINSRAESARKNLVLMLFWIKKVHMEYKIICAAGENFTISDFLSRNFHWEIGLLKTSGSRSGSRSRINPEKWEFHFFGIGTGECIISEWWGNYINSDNRRGVWVLDNLFLRGRFRIVGTAGEKLSIPGDSTPWANPKYTKNFAAGAFPAP